MLVCGRIKPHTDFVGDIESGLMKMMLIGLGKHEGAKVYHRAIQDYSFGQIVRSVAGRVLESCRIAAGVAIGLFIGVLIPVAQILLAAVAAVALRANIPVAAAATLITTCPGLGSGSATSRTSGAVFHESSRNARTGTSSAAGCPIPRRLARDQGPRRRIPLTLTCG